MIGECSGLDGSQAAKHKSSNLSFQIKFRSVFFIMANFANLQISMLFLCNLFNEEKVLPKHYWFSNSVVPRKMHNFVAFFWWKTRFSSSRNLFGSHLSTSLFYLWNFTERNEKCIVKIIDNQSVTRTNIRIYLCQENDTNEYPNIFVLNFRYERISE